MGHLPTGPSRWINVSYYTMIYSNVIRISCNDNDMSRYAIFRSEILDSPSVVDLDVLFINENTTIGDLGIVRSTEGNQNVPERGRIRNKGQVFPEKEPDRADRKW